MEKSKEKDESKELIKEKEKNIHLKNELTKKESWLQTSPLVLGLASLVISLFLLTENLTGNVILNLDETVVSYVGNIFFIVAILSLFFYFIKKRYSLEN